MKDFILGMIFAIPIFAFILLLFKDIILKSFVKFILVQSTKEPEITPEVVSESAVKDILVSYRLLLILKEEFNFLITHKYLLKDADINILNSKLFEVNQAIYSTEGILDEKGIDDYKDIKKEIEKGKKKMSGFI